jgi:hypothetical protein
MLVYEAVRGEVEAINAYQIPDLNAQLARL